DSFDLWWHIHQNTGLSQENHLRTITTERERAITSPYGKIDFHTLSLKFIIRGSLQFKTTKN
ncbi:MAG: hypothetical protein K0U54_11855, partial [Bacteroidetes bacterium]|nr:hypothetical protein [Bacteroidota bacterium]